MSKKKYCSICGEYFNFLMCEYECENDIYEDCKNVVCKNCITESSFLTITPDDTQRIEYCIDCKEKLLKEISPIVTVRHSHVGGHRITKSFKRIEGEHWEKDRDDTINNIKFQALEMGANAIVNFDFDCEKQRRGGYIYREWLASGKPVIIKKKK
jgi:uncharacterized protein YbjQ (UPF0145 family)